MTAERVTTLGLPAGVFLAFLACGWWLGGGDARRDEAEVPAPVVSRRERGGADRPYRAGVPQSVQRRLVALRAAGTPVERRRAAIELALSIPVGELAAWYEGEWYPYSDGIDENLFYQITRRRWLEEDPEGLMDHSLLRGSKRLSELVGDWVKLDRVAALAWAGKIRDPDDFRKLASPLYRQLAREAPLEALAEVEGLMKRSAGGSWGLDGVLEVIAKQSPEALRAEAAGWSGSLAKMANIALATASLSEDFTAGARELAGRPDGLELFKETLGRGSLDIEVLANAAALPEGWFAELCRKRSYSMIHRDPRAWLEADLVGLGLDDGAARGIQVSALSQLGSKDPDFVLEFVGREEFTENQLSSIAGNVASNLARRDPEKAEEWLDGLVAIAGDEVVNSVRESIGEVVDLAEAPKLTPEDWVAGLAENGNRGWNLNYQRMQQTETWDHSALDASREAFAELPADRRRPAAEGLLNRVRSFGFPGVAQFYPLQGDAVAYLVGNPQVEEAAADGNAGRAQQNLISAASSLASSWGREDPVAAGEWVDSLPAGEERQWAARNLAVNWAEYDPAGAAGWVRGLPAAEREAAETAMAEGER